jgi:hypothetical protein
LRRSNLANILLVSLVLVLMTTPLSQVWATNAGSYIVGFWKGSSTAPVGPQGNQNTEFDSNTCKLSPSDAGFDYLIPFRTTLPAITNTTACQDGFLAGWKHWCVTYPVDCVSNMTIGDFPPFVLKVHQEYLKGWPILKYYGQFSNNYSLV